MIRKRLRAVEDLVGHFEFVARDNPGAAERLADSVEATLEVLEQMHRLGRRWTPRGPLREVRVRGVSGFENYILYHRPIPGGIEWLAIRHAAQQAPERGRE